MTMQSQPGRFCDEKYRNLKLQEQQFTAHSTASTVSLPDFYSKVEKPVRLSVLEQLLSAKKPPVESGPDRKSWAFAAQSRTDYYKSTGSKDHNPSAGYYMPQYNSVFKATPAPKIPPMHSHRNYTPTGSRPSEEEDERPVRRLMLPSVPFDLQLSRPDIVTLAPNVSEKRFEQIPFSPVSSRVRKPVTVDFSKMLRRPNYAPARPHPRYNPNYDFVSKKVVPDIDFGKLTSRGDPHLARSTQLAYRNVKFSQTASRARTSQFLTSRPVSDVFPTHMVKVHSRTSLTVLQEGSLLMNGLRSASVAGSRESDTAMRGTMTERKSAN